MKLESFTQSLKSPLYVRMLALKAPETFQRPAYLVRWALQIQQRALVRMTNRSLFESLVQQAHVLGSIQGHLRQVLKNLHTLNELSSVTYSDECSDEFKAKVVEKFRDFSRFICDTSFSDAILPRSGSPHCKFTANGAEMEPRDEDLMDEESISSFLEVFLDQSRPKENFSMIHALNEAFSSHNPSIVELQTFFLFFSITSPLQPKLVELLRSQLRELSSFKHLNQASDRCSNAFLGRTIEQLGSDTSGCIQSLEAFTATMNGIISDNRQLIKNLRMPSRKVWRQPFAK
ncbi:hypothetical protein Ciccas_010719 [Cichlidogyrus casuarinus]|uniref:Uncharacterized protein n=1 Tax=Cichlidogyrus casuarinus TaxID=1844966 RepID=A0ABD2PTE7_9PLAT